MACLGLKLRRGNARDICLTSRNRPIGCIPRKSGIDSPQTFDPGGVTPQHRRNRGSPASEMDDPKRMPLRLAQ